MKGSRQMEHNFDRLEQPSIAPLTAPEDVYVAGDPSITDKAQVLGFSVLGNDDSPPNPYRTPKDAFTNLEDPLV